MGDSELHFDVLKSIQKHINKLKPWLPKWTIVGIGEYIADVVSKGTVINKETETVPILIGISPGDTTKLNRFPVKKCDVIGIKADYPTHFWFHIFPKIIRDDMFITQLKNRSMHRAQNAIVLSTTWDGVGSGLLPAVILQFKLWNVRSIAVALLPSKVQPLVAHFNALASMGLSITKGTTPVLLIDRDCLESYVGVDRRGLTIRGSVIINNLLELMLSKETFIDEITMLSKSFNVKLYTVLLSTGASLRIYGSLQNIFHTASLRPLSTFDLSNATVVYALLRIPLQLKDKLSKEKIEFAITDWLKEMVNLKSIYISEPIYVDDVSDRIDVVMFIGGFYVAKTFNSVEKKISKLKSDAIKSGIISEDEWREIIQDLAEN